MDFRKQIKEFAETPISRHVMLELLRDYKRPNDKISELLKNKSLLAIKRGLYIVGSKMDLTEPEPFLIANHLRGPSYVSLESAMSYWNMIPERAYEISSVTTQTTRRYNTAVGRFSYQHLRTPYYSFGLKNINHSPKQNMLIASPEKALCDKIVLTTKIDLRSRTQTRDFLMEDLRIEEEMLHSLDTSLIEFWIPDAPKKNSLKMLVKTLLEL